MSNKIKKDSENGSDDDREEEQEERIHGVIEGDDNEQQHELAQNDALEDHYYREVDDGVEEDEGVDNRRDAAMNNESNLGNRDDGEEEFEEEEFEEEAEVDEEVHEEVHDENEMQQEDQNDEVQEEDEEREQEQEGVEGEEGDDEEQGEDPLIGFYRLCLQIARNDPTLTEVYTWPRHHQLPNIGERRQWNEPDLFLVGNALAGNTHLKGLVIDEISPSTPRRAYQVLCDGIVQSKIIYLTTLAMSQNFQRCLFDENETMTTLQVLSVCRTDLHIRCLTRRNQFLHHLHLIHCHLDDAEMLIFSRDVLSNIPCLSSLDLSENQISDVGISYFCEQWKDDSSIRELRLSLNAIGSNGALQLLQATKRHSGFVKLALDLNKNIGHDGLEQIGRELASLSIITLYIHGCVREPTTPATPEFRQAGEAAGRSLADGLRSNTSLVNLCVGVNYLGANGARMLMQALSSHRSLRTLSLADDTSIGFSGLQWIGMELPLIKLREISLGQAFPDYSWPNPETPAAMAAGQALLDGVRQNGTLTNLEVYDLPAVWNDPIQFYLNWNESYRSLLRSDAIAPAVWPYILEYFQRQSTRSNAYFSLREQPWLAARHILNS